MPLGISALARLLAVGIALIDHGQHARALVRMITISTASITASVRVCDGRDITTDVVRGASLDATARRHHPIIVNLLEVKNTADVLVVLLRDLHHLGRLLPLLFELLLCLLDLILLLRDPLFELEVLALEGARRDLVLVEHLVDVFERGLLPVRNRLFPNLEHLGVLLWVEILRCQLARAHELPEGIALKDRATRAILGVPLRPI